MFVFERGRKNVRGESEINMKSQHVSAAATCITDIEITSNGRENCKEMKRLGHPSEDLCIHLF